jgi:hypothetical protein
MRNNRVLLETLFSIRSVPRGYKEKIGATKSFLYGSQKQEHFSWKRAADQRGLGHGSRRIAIVRSRYQETSRKDTAGWKNMAFAGVICKVWELAIVL